MNTLGKHFKITCIGESHGELIGIVIDGCPAGLKLDHERLQGDLNRRRPGQSKITTSRTEQDRADVLTGLYNGYTTGAPITIIIKNQDMDSSKYLKAKWTPRPGHADYTAELRYGKYRDPRGGGRFSGRLTASYVIAGSVAKQLMETIGTTVVAYTHQIGRIRASEPVSLEQIENNLVRCPDLKTAEKMIEEIEKAKANGDSIGGKVKAIAFKPPRGIGDPVFDTLEGDLSKAFFSIPAVKAVEFGIGVKAAELLGSENNDQYNIVDGKIQTKTNNSGGIFGGISNGMPIETTITFKPTPSISKPQHTVDLKEMRETIIRIEGRHDPCIVPRAVPVVEAMMAVVLVDHSLSTGKIPNILR
jgi:chorismate synthase